MIIVCKNTASQKKIDALIEDLKAQGLETHCSTGALSTIIGLVGDTSRVDLEALEALDIAEKVQRVSEPYKLVNRKFHSDDTVVEAGAEIEYLIADKQVKITAGKEMKGTDSYPVYIAKQHTV